MADSFVCCGSIRDLEKWDFQRIPKIYQGFWIFFPKILYLGVVVYLFAPSLKSEKRCFYRFTNQNIVLWQILNYKHISLVFGKYWSKTTRRQNLQNKGNRTNWGPEFFVIYWLGSLIIFCLIIYQILLTYFFCFSFCNWYYLEKNFVLLNV